MWENLAVYFAKLGVLMAKNAWLPFCRSFPINVMFPFVWGTGMGCELCGHPQWTYRGAVMGSLQCYRGTTPCVARHGFKTPLWKVMDKCVIFPTTKHSFYAHIPDINPNNIVSTSILAFIASLSASIGDPIALHPNFALIQFHFPVKTNSTIPQN